MQTLCISRSNICFDDIRYRNVYNNRADSLSLRILFLFNYLFYPYSRKKEVKLNLELSRLPQGSNTLSPTSASKTLASSPLSSTTTSTTTATTTTSPIPVNQIRR